MRPGILFQLTPELTRRHAMKQTSKLSIKVMLIPLASNELLGGAFEYIEDIAVAVVLQKISVYTRY